MVATRTDETGVSSVVGTILMLAITVSVFGGFAVVVLGDLQSDPQPPRSDLAAVQDEGSLYFLHKGGEGFSADGTLHVNRRGYDVAIPFTDPRLAGLGPTWDVGDLLCVQGDADGCLYASHEDIRGAFLVDGDSLVGDVGERGQEGTPPAYPDLIVELAATSPAEIAAGMTATWTARITNVGTVATDGSALLVAILVDGNQVAIASASGPLGANASVDAVSTPAWTATTIGSHTLELEVDQGDAILEESEGNNDASTTFQVLAGVSDPGEPFIDADGDGLYGPGDTLVDATEFTDGSYTGSGDLTLPASIGPIEAATIDFETSGSLVINTDITSTTGVLSIAASDVEFGEGVTVTSPAGMTFVQDGTFTADGATLVSDGPVNIGSSSPSAIGTVVNLAGATVDNTGGTSDLVISWETGDLNAEGVTLRSRGAISIGGANNGHTTGDVFLDGATLDNTAGTSAITFHDLGGSVSMEDAVVRTKGAVTIAASTGLDMTGADIANTAGSGSGTFTTSTGALQCDPCTIAIKGSTTLSGASLDLDDASTNFTSITVSGTNNDLQITATSGGISAAYAVFVVQDELKATLPSSPAIPNNWKITVTGAVLDDANNSLDITNASNASQAANWSTGTPATGYSLT